MQSFPESDPCCWAEATTLVQGIDLLVNLLAAKAAHFTRMQRADLRPSRSLVSTRDNVLLMHNLRRRA